MKQFLTTSILCAAILIKTSTGMDQFNQNREFYIGKKEEKNSLDCTNFQQNEISNLKLEDDTEKKDTKIPLIKKKISKKKKHTPDIEEDNQARHSVQKYYNENSIKDLVSNLRSTSSKEGVIQALVIIF
jgi:hypothetical protein